MTFQTVRIIRKTIFLFFFISSFQIHAQIGINSDGSNPDASAMLDIKSTTKGLLIPRMTTAQRDNINSPTIGLIVYVNDDNNFYYYNGTIWQQVTTNNSISNTIADADGDTKIQVEESNNEDIVRIDIGGTEVLTIQKLTSGTPYLNLKSPNSNTLIGDNISPNVTGTRNVLIGEGTGASLTSGQRNTLLGYHAGASLTDEIGNVLIGDAAGDSNTKSHNLMIGTGAGGNNNGNNNVFLGFAAGLDNNGNNNVFIGFNSGRNQAGSSLLWIANGVTNTPLIYGEFNNDLLRINGTLNINNAFSFPTADGANGQVLETNGSGSLSWTSAVNTDNQSLSLSSNILSLTNGGSVDLSSYLDNTDAQVLTLNSNTLSLANGGSINLSNYLDADDLGNHSATQNIKLNDQWLSRDGGNTGIRIRNNGNVGIGESTPDARLYIKDDFAQQVQYVATIENTNGGAWSNGLLIKAGQNTQSVNNRFIRFERPDGLELGSIRQESSGSIAYNSASDRRLKTNIATTHYGLEDLLQIDVMDYHYKVDTADLCTGFIAQQLYEHYPEAVSVGGEDEKTNPWTVDYGKVTPLLVKAVQEQQVQIEELKTENEALKTQVAKINEMQAMMLEMQAQMETMNARAEK